MNETNVVIAALGNFTGNEGAVATNLVRSMQIAISEFNSNPDSIYRVQLKKINTQGTPEGSAAAAQSAVDTELVVGVIGPFESSEASAAAPILASAQLPFFLTNLPDTSFSQQGWKSLRRLIPTNRQEGISLGKEAARLSADGKVAIVFDGTPQGGVAAEGARSAIEEDGKQLTRLDKISDVNVSADAVIRDQVSVVLYAGEAEIAGKLAAALGSKGYKGKLITTHQVRESNFVKVAGQYARGTISNCLCADRSQHAQRFASEYSNRFKLPAPPYSVETYDAAWMLLEAIQEVPPKPEDVREFLAVAKDFLGDGKLYRFDPNGDMINPPIWMKEYKANKWVTLNSSAPSATKVSD